MRYCAPDLPFFQTVLWYFKQIGAAIVIILTLFFIYWIFFILTNKK